ncbi:MAG: glycoside hydrolase family 16 protein [Propionibacteriales bacterium]|nr:glycoside hydrolase family 16 protein [Propionibacteriales bacterium]
MTRFGVWLVGAVATGSVMVLASLGTTPTSASPAGVPADRLAAAAVAPTCGGERPAKAGGGKYVCSFEENFSSTRLDPTKWIVTETATSGLHASLTGCYVNRPQNVLVANGKLNLASRLERFACKQPFGIYSAQSTAGAVTSTKRFAQTYGRFEFRARFPSATVGGAHSALWLYPQEHTYGAWPHSGEVDVAEWFSARPSKVYPSVHYGGENRKGTGHDCTVPTASTAFHRYAVEWTPTSMRFLYDGKVCHVHSWIAASPLSGSRPFDKPFYIVMNQVTGQLWNAVSRATPAVSTLQVDWVRVWR